MHRQQSSSSTGKKVPSLKRAHPVLLSHLTSSKEPTPGPSATKTSRHSDSAKPLEVLSIALIGSPAPKLARRLPSATKTAAWNSTPDHPAFEPIDLGFKNNTARLTVKFGKILLELRKEPDLPECCLSREEYAIIEDNADMLLSLLEDPDSSAYETTFWLLIKDRDYKYHGTQRKDIAYLCIEEFGGKLYVDIRDYFHPDGPDDGLLHTGRGIKMDLKGFRLFKDSMCSIINDKWTDAIRVLPASQSPIKTVRAKSDPMEDNSQVIFCDWLIMICNTLLKAVPYRRISFS